AAEIERRGLKVVCLGGAGFPDRRYVGTSGDSLCRLAIEHLADRGFNRLAYFGAPASWSVARGKTFARLVAERGLAGHVFALSRQDRRGGHETLMRALIHWLETLEKP